MKTSKFNLQYSVRLIILICFTLTIIIPKSYSQSRNKKEVGESTFQILDIDNGIKFTSVESTFKVFNNSESGKSNYYLARFKTSTIKDLSQEGQDRTIEVTVSPLNQLNMVKYKIKQNCDQLDLFDEYYRTINYGCCLQSSKVKLYDYSSNLIIEGSEKIFRGNIPNNRLKDFYFSYTSPTDTLTLGQVNFWFNSNEKYQIVLRSKRSTEHNSLEVCPVLFPKIEMNQNDSVSFDKEET